MDVLIIVFVCEKHAEEQGLIEGVRSYVSEHKLAWDVVPCVQMNVQRIKGMIEHGGKVVFVGRTLNTIAPYLLQGVLWVDWAYSQASHQRSISDTFVQFEPKSIGQAAARYLLNNGVKSFAVKGPLSLNRSDWEPRILGFVECVEESGHDCLIWRERPVSTHAELLKVLKDFVDVTEKPIGFFAVNDNDGKFLSECLIELGVSIPLEAMVIGGSNSALSALRVPSLSTVRLPFQSLGRSAAFQAHRLISGEEAPPIRIPSLGVIERDSTRRNQCVKDSIVTKALRRVERSRNNIPTVEELAELSGVSRKVLTKHFNSCLHTTPKKWLLEYAMQRAVALLVSNDLTLEQISKRCGYRQCTSFIYQFKERYGVTPSRYRNFYHSKQHGSAD